MEILQKVQGAIAAAVYRLNEVQTTNQVTNTRSEDIPEILQQKDGRLLANDCSADTCGSFMQNIHSGNALSFKFF